MSSRARIHSISIPEINSKLKYLENLAAAISVVANADVATFNGRTGAVVPLAGDYSVAQITGAQAINSPYVAQTATYTILSTDEIIEFTSGTFTATLPTAVGIAGKKFYLKNSGTGFITIATTSAQTIDGTATITLSSGQAVILISNNANYIIF